MKNDKTVFISPFSLFGIPPSINFGFGMPRIEIPAYLSDWPSEEATNIVLLTIKKLIHLGFKGVKIEKASAPDDKEGVQSERVITADANTPEGRVVEAIIHFASFGQPTDLDVTIELVEEIYANEGLELPYTKGAQK